MKRIFIIFIGLYIIVSTAVVFIVDHDLDKEIEILSIQKDYARMLTEDETIDIPIYISKEKSFFTSVDNIIDAKILSESDEISIEIKEIKKEEKTVFYLDKEYYIYYFMLDLNSVFTLNLKLDFKDALLFLKYNNEEELTLDIGHINIMFSDVYHFNHIDYTRLYSINHMNSIVGIYIELVNKTGETVFINHIDTLNNHMLVNINDSKIVYEPLDHLKNIDNIIPGYDNIVTEFPIQKPISFKHNTAFFMPINYLNQFNYIIRFPLIINYKYNDEIYNYIIDDFMFYHYGDDLEYGLYEVSHYQYHY
ncbi:hypothetical protein KHQ88_03970 [Mycoplasmatota bacterium]|nr:hypothetical protein KHQ88_03970 [Mycoplasmatota bacterium]